MHAKSSRAAVVEDILARVVLAIAMTSLIASAAIGASAHPKPAPPAGSASEAVSPFAGHWEADMQGDGRMFTFVFDFKVKHESLGGTLAIAGRDGDVKIAGNVKKGMIHFEQFGLWDGVIDGANLKLTRGLDGGKIQHMTAHRTARP